MAYCTAEELAIALRISVTPINTATLQRCIAAAATEIDAFLDRDDPLPDDGLPLAKSDNIFRAVQWYKASDIAIGGGGTPETGLLNAPTEPFTPMAMVPYKQNWGIA